MPAPRVFSALQQLDLLTTTFRVFGALCLLGVLFRILSSPVWLLPGALFLFAPPKIPQTTRDRDRTDS